MGIIDGSTGPSPDEIRLLYPWAIVAYAARCARRVQPLINRRWPGRQDFHTICQVAINNAEHTAAIDRNPSSRPIDYPLADFAGADQAARQLSVQCYQIAQAAHADDGVDQAFKEPASLAAQAIATAVDCYNTTVVAHNSRMLESYMGGIAGFAANSAHAAALASSIADVRRDFSFLLSRYPAASTTGYVQIPPGVFGPMWPNGTPPGWP